MTRIKLNDEYPEIIESLIDHYFIRETEALATRRKISPELMFCIQDLRIKTQDTINMLITEHFNLDEEVKYKLLRRKGVYYLEDES